MINRIFKTKFDPATGLSYAVSELGKSYNSKKLSLTVASTALLGSLFTSNPVHAACSTDTSDPQRTVMTCTGDTGFTMVNTPNTTLINEGTIQAGGAFGRGVVGVVGTGSNDATSFIGINRGHIIWNSPTSSQDLGKADAAVEINFLDDNQQREDNYFLNDTTGKITVVVDSAQNEQGAINAIANHAKYAKTHTENKGKILISSTTQTNIIAGIVGGGKNIELENSGEIVATSAGAAGVAGIIAWAEDAETISINNSGTINSSNTKNAYGIELQSIRTKIKSIQATNSGTIVSSHYGIAGIFRSDNVDIPIEINNTENGLIDAGEIAIAGTNDTAPFHINNKGKLISRAAKDPYAIATANGNDVITNSGEITGIVYTGEGNDKFTSTAGKLTNGVFMDKGNDSLNLSGTEVADLLTIDGNFGNNSMAADEVNTFNLNQTLTGSSRPEGESNNSRIVNWNIMNIGQNGVLNLTGDLMSGLPNNALGEMQIAAQGTLALAANTKEANVGYNVINEGTIDLFEGSAQNNPEAKLTIKGNYEGRTGSKVLVKSLWNNPDEQKNDLLVIEGNATGQSEVLVVNQILGDVTADTAEKNGLFKAPVITVNGTDAGVFSGEAKTTNAGKAQLKREGNSYYWTLKANDEDIIAEPVPAYVQQPYINRQMMLAQLGKLHERVGEQRYLSLKNAVAEKQLWARTSYDFTTLQGKQRFGTDVQSGFIQVGKDLGFRLNQDNSQQHAGLMFTYGWAKSKFFDKFRAENGQVVADKYTGKSHTDMLSVGGYHTYYGSNGFYVDTVAQLSWLQNRYNSIDNTKAKQNGVGVAASIEVGKSFPLLNPKLAIEPQAQLTYQRVWLNGFNDGTREVKKGSQDSITARLGARVIWNESLENNASQLYFTANLIQTLKGRDSNIQVGSQSVSERYGDLSAEFGVGGQYPITPNLSIYADMRYVVGVGDHNQTHKGSQLSRRSYNGRVGLRYSF